MPSLFKRGVLEELKWQPWFRLLCWIVLFAYGGTLAPVSSRAYAQGGLIMPSAAGLMFPAVSALPFPVLKAISIDPIDPFKINFLADAGDLQTIDEEQSSLLVKYFLTFLAVPEKDLWVNLSPSEPNRIVNPVFGSTQAGRDMLMEDYLLKQLASSLTYPDSESGKKFWSRISARIERRYGSIDIPVDAFSRIWVVPERAVVYERQGAAFISESYLKVVLDEDYFVMRGRMTEGVDDKEHPLSESSAEANEVNAVYLDIAREIIIPEIEREVNSGTAFGQLRQMFHALILAVWFKRQLRDHVVNRVYSDQNRIFGIQNEDEEIVQKIYDQYMTVLKEGVYDIIREEYDPDREAYVPRRYFSGGFSWEDTAQRMEFVPAPSSKGALSRMIRGLGKNLCRFVVYLIPKGMSRNTLFALALAAGVSMSPMTSANASDLSLSGRAPNAHVVHISEVRSEMAGLNSGENASGYSGVSQTVLSRGDAVPQLDQRYFSFMKEFLTMDDVKNIQGRRNPLTGQVYDFDWNYIGRNWESVFSPSSMRWAEEAVVVVAQHKLGIREDGRMGPETRSALQSRMTGGMSVKGETPIVKRPLVVEETKTATVKEYQDETSVVPDVAHKAGEVNVKSALAVPPVVNAPSAQIQGDKRIVQAPSEHTALGNEQNRAAPYAVETQTTVVAEEIHLQARADGIVRGLDASRTEYRKGDLVCRLENIETVRQKQELTQQLAAEQKRLAELRALADQQAASPSEILPLEKNVARITQELARLDGESVLEEVRAPVNLSVRSAVASNGMTVSQGAVILNGFSRERMRLTLELPLNQMYFGRIKHFTVNGQVVERIIRVDWRLNPAQSRALATFVFTGPPGIPDPANAHVVMEILPSRNEEDISGPLIQGRAATVSSVKETVSAVVQAPSNGPVRIMVREGDFVRKGQTLAVQEGSQPAEYQRTMQSYHRVRDQLEQFSSRDGVHHVTRDTLAALEKEEASLRAQLDALRARVRQLTMTAPQDGLITVISDAESAVFREGEEIIRLRTGQVVIGSTQDMKAAVFLPASLTNRVGDPVLVQIPSGQFVPARISQINTSPVSASVNLKDVTAVELIASDMDHLLWENLPVRVIIPEEAQRGYVEELFAKHQARVGNATGLSAKSPVLPGHAVRPGSIHSQKRQMLQTPLSDPDQRPAVVIKAALPPEQGQVLELAELAALVAGNRIMTGPLSLEVLEKEAKERLHQGFDLDLRASVFLKEGKLFFSGGLGGMIQGVVGSLSTGNAISASLPLVFNLSGQLIDILSGKQARERELAMMMTDIARHHMEEEVVRHIHEASLLHVEISAAQKTAGELRALLDDLEAAKRVVAARHTGGFSSSSELAAIDQKIAGTRSHLAGWQNKIEAWSADLSYMAGMPLNTTLAPVLMWDGEFLGVTSQEHQAMAAQMLSGDHMNARWKNARLAVDAVERTISLQRAGTLPSIDLHGLYLSSGKNYNPLYNLISGAVMSTGSLAQGSNMALNVEIPVIDTKQKAMDVVAGIQREKAQFNLQTVKAELERDLNRAVSNLADLSRQIGQAEADYQNAVRAFDRKAQRPDLYRADQLTDDRMAVASAGERVIQLKASYFKAETGLRRLQVMTYAESRVVPRDSKKIDQPYAAPLSTASNSASIEPAEHVRDTAFIRDGGPEGTAAPVQHFGISGSIRTASTEELGAGVVTYTPPDAQGRLTGLWPLVASSDGRDAEGPFSEMVKILTQDPDMMTRLQALDVFLEQGPGGKAFLPAVQDIILQSPYADVTGSLLLQVAGQTGADPRFLLQIIDESIQQNNMDLVWAGFQLLNEVLSRDITALEQFSAFQEDPFTEDRLGEAWISADGMRRVLLTFLARAPEDWIGRTRLLQSSYWSIEQMAGVHHVLTSSGSDQETRLASLFYDEMIRRLALINLDEVFNKGPLKQLPVIYAKGDVYTSFMIETFREMNRQFLVFSPDWRQAQQYLPRELHTRALQAADYYFSAVSVGSSDQDLFYSIPDVLSGDALLLLERFDQLDLGGQHRYFQQTNSLFETARIMEQSPDLRGDALNRLMESPQGRILALQAYIRSDDEALCGLVETQNWAGLLRDDLRLIDDPVSMDIIRRSMEKMYNRDGNARFLDLRLKTYGLSELHMVSDPRGDGPRLARINAAATGLALKMVEQNNFHRQRFWAGQTMQRPEELALIQEIQQRIQKGNDAELNRYIAQLEREPRSSVKGLLNDIVSWRDQAEAVIAANDQTFPKVSFRVKVVLWAIGLFSGFVGGYVWIRDIFLRREKTGDLILRLRREFAAEKRNGSAVKDGFRTKISAWMPRDLTSPNEMPGIVDIPKGGFHEGSAAALERWHGFLIQWKNQDRGGSYSQNFVDDFNEILNSASHILVQTAYSPAIMGKVETNGHIFNEQYYTIFAYFNLLAVDTLNVFNALLAGRNDLNAYERQTLLRNISILKKMVEYATAYLRVLEYRGIIDKVMNYKFPDNHWTERSRIYPVFRLFLLYSYQLSVSERKLQTELPVLLKQGEELLSGLYGNAEERQNIIRQSQKVLGESIKDARNLASYLRAGVGNKHKMRSFLSRFRLFIPLILGGVLALNFLGFYPISMEASALSIIGIVISFLIFWVPHVKIMQMSWTSIAERVMEQLVSDAQTRLRPLEHDGKGVLIGAGERQIVEQVVLEGMEQLAKELDLSHKPSADMIVIIQGSAGHEQHLNDYINAGRGKIFREDVPVKVLPVLPDLLSGSGNAYFQAIKFVREKLQDQDFIREYPHLNALSSWQEARVIFIFDGDRQSEGDFPLDWSVVNAYRVAASMDAPDARRDGHADVNNRRGGHIVIYSRDAYFGVIPKYRDWDLHLSGQWVSIQELGNLGLLNTDFAGDGVVVKDVLEKLDIENLRTLDNCKTYQCKVLRYLDERYDFKKHGLKQFPALTGVMVLGSKVVGILEDVLDGLLAEPELWGQLKYLHMTSDILNNLLRPSDEILEGYLATRIKLTDIRKEYEMEGPEDARKIFQPFFRLFYDARVRAGGRVSIGLNIPHSGTAHVVHIRGKTDSEEVHALLEQAGFGIDRAPLDSVPNNSYFKNQDPEDKGGIDFSDIQNAVEFQNNQMLPEIDGGLLHPSNALPSFQLFQGFDFKIIGLQPLENPMNFLLS